MKVSKEREKKRKLICKVFVHFRRRRQERGHGSSRQGEEAREEEEVRAEDVRVQRRVCGREVGEVQEGLEHDAEGQGHEHRFEHNADLQTVRVDRGGAGQCCGDEVDGGNARRCVNDADRDERHVTADAAGNA